MGSDTVVVRVRQSIAGPHHSHPVGDLVAMPSEVARRYWADGIVEAADDYDEEDVVEFGTRRRGREPRGRQATSTPGGQQGTATPGGDTGERRPSGQDRSGEDDDPEPADDVPANVTDVKAWVGDDPARAAAALQVEQDRTGGPRSTLEPWLAERAG